MQKINMTSSSSSSGHTNTTTKLEGDHHQHQHDLPGFRFHPTDEELVGFYLRRKVDRKLPATRIIDNLIKHVDIYKFDPWDLPKAKNGGDKECYFFCKRGRKYKNSIRPNRVTGSGFWKATGIDKPVYSLNNGDQGREHDCIIGLKKTLVYYRGCAGKGTKTDWMMHEFRLPSDNSTVDKSNAATQEAEVWTVCKIFKRNASYKKYTPVGVVGWRSSEHASSGSGKQVCVDTNSSQICNTTTADRSSNNNTLIIMNNLKEEAASNYISFGPPQPPSSSSPYALFQNYNEKKPSVMPMSTMPTTTTTSSIVNYHCFEEIRNNNNNLNHLNPFQAPNNNVVSAAASSTSCCNISGPDNPAIMMEQDQDQHFTYENWDELRSVVEFALDHQSQSPHHHYGHGPL